MDLATNAVSSQLLHSVLIEWDSLGFLWGHLYTKPRHSFWTKGTTNYELKQMTHY
jgi:hypothetical protein